VAGKQAGATRVGPAFYNFDLPRGLSLISSSVEAYKIAFAKSFTFTIDLYTDSLNSGTNGISIDDLHTLSLAPTLIFLALRQC
jgi:hypothetical protein